MSAKPAVPKASVPRMALTMTMRRRRTMCMSGLAGQEQGHIVLQFGRAGPLSHRIEDDGDDLLLLAIGVLGYQLHQPLLAEHFVVFVFRLGDAVREADQQ